MTLPDALRGEGLILAAVNLSSGEPVEVFCERDLPFARAQYRLVIHQYTGLDDINLMYDTLEELERELAQSLPQLDPTAWQNH